jgi:hypothetical protein
LDSSGTYRAKNASHWAIAKTSQICGGCASNEASRARYQNQFFDFQWQSVGEIFNVDTIIIPFFLIYKSLERIALGIEGVPLEEVHPMKILGLEAICFFGR